MDKQEQKPTSFRAILITLILTISAVAIVLALAASGTLNAEIVAFVVTLIVFVGIIVFAVIQLRTYQND